MDWRPSVLTLDAPLERGDSAIGLADLRKGLYSIVQGYLVWLVMVLASVGLVWYCFHEVHSAEASPRKVENASTVLFGGACVLFLVSSFSLWLILRGKWICLMNAPEQFQAKWLMFAAMVCLLAGPAFSLGSYLVEDSKDTSRISKRKMDADAVLRHAEDYRRDLTALSTRGCLKLAGSAAGLLSSVFFVLFLRALDLYFNAAWRAMFAEFFLLFIALLVVWLALLLLKPSPLLLRPGMLLGLAAGWLLCGLWYFLLILNTLGCIGNILDERR